MSELCRRSWWRGRYRTTNKSSRWLSMMGPFGCRSCWRLSIVVLAIAKIVSFSIRIWWLDCRRQLLMLLIIHWLSLVVDRRLGHTPHKYLLVRHCGRIQWEWLLVPGFWWRFLWCIMLDIRWIWTISVGSWWRRIWTATSFSPIPFAHISVGSRITTIAVAAISITKMD